MTTVRAYNDTVYKRLPLKKLEKIAADVLQGEKIERAFVSIVLVNDEKIHNLNREFLRHDYPTDVLTFSLSEEERSGEYGADDAKDGIEGEIYISVETARAQAAEYGVSPTNELMRLAAHGALHLAGYDDARDEERKHMQDLEDRYLAMNAK